MFPNSTLFTNIGLAMPQQHERLSRAQLALPCPLWVINLSECWVASPGFVRVSSEGGHVELFEAPHGNLVPPPAVKLCVRFPIARLLSSLKEACQSEEVAATGLSGRYQRRYDLQWNPNPLQRAARRRREWLAKVYEIATTFRAKGSALSQHL